MSDGSDGIILQLRDFPAMFFAHNQDVAEIVILMGLPGAGKTTFYQSFFAASHAHISKDLWPNARERDQRQQRLLAEHLGAGRPVVVDNTNPTAKERAALIAAAQAHGARVVGYFFDITTRQAVARNAERTGRAKVAVEAVPLFERALTRLLDEQAEE